MGTVAIRLMEAGEAPVVGDVLLDANAEHLAVFPEAVAAAYGVELTDVAPRAAGDEVYVAEVDGRVVGTATLLIDADRDRHPWPPGGVVLRFLAVHPGWRGRRIGERLTEACIERARAQGARFVGLHTAPVMAAAHRLYERMGFERAPELDFDAGAHYAGGASGNPATQGWAYVLRLAT